MREVVVGCFDEVTALPARVGGLAVAVRSEERCRRARGTLAGAFEGIELVVIYARGFIAESV